MLSKIRSKLVITMRFKKKVYRLRNSIFEAKAKDETIMKPVACNPISSIESIKQRERSCLLVLELDGVREKHGADIAGVRTRDGDDGGAGQLVEDPRRLKRRVAEGEERRRRH